MQIEYIDIDKVIPYANNPRNNDGEAVDRVAASIKEYGFKNPIIIDKENVIVAGHTRLKAAKKLGIDKVPIIRADDLTPAQVKAFRLAENRVSEYATWDNELLSLELEGLQDLDFDLELTGFEDLEIGKLLGREEKEEKPERKDLSDEVGETFEVIVECKSELEQEEIFYRLTSEGLVCRTLTL